MTRTLFTLACVTALVSACGSEGSDPPARRDSGTAGPRDSGVVPGVDSGPGPGPVDSGPGPGPVDSGPGPAVDSGGAPRMGACINATDEAIFMSMDIEMVVSDCAEGCFGGGPCTRDCLIERVGMTMGCATCFGDVVGCTASMCAFRCFESDSPDCAMCRDEMGCTAAFEACSGLED